MPIVLPPLRERRNDIPQIAVCYLNSTDAQKTWEIDLAATEAPTSPRLEWHGNIRELESVLERARNRARVDGSGIP